MRQFGKVLRRGAVAVCPERQSPRWRPAPGVLAATARKSGTALADQAVVSGTTFATTVIVGRACSKEQFGLFALAFSIMLFCCALQVAVISAPYIVRRAHMSGDALRQYNGNVLLYLLVLCCLASLGLLMVTGISAAGLGPAGLAPITAAMSGVVALRLLKEYARYMCFAGMRMGSGLAIDLLACLMQVGGLLLLAQMGRLTPVSAFGVIGLACGMASIAWLLHSRSSFRIRIRQAAIQFGEHWKLARFTFASGLLYGLTMSLYPWIVASECGMAAAAVWAACFAIAALVNPLLTGMQNLLAPHLAHGYAQAGETRLRRLAVWAGVLCCILMPPYALLLWLFGGLAVVSCFGADYAGHEQLVAVLGVAMLATAAGFSFSRALFGIARAEFDFLSNVVALAVLLIAGTWMAARWGPLGVAYGMLAANAAASLIKATAFLRFVRPVAGVAV